MRAQWSRFSGGSGAPYWTLPACGINPRNFTATQAAIMHCEYPTSAGPDPASLPAMIWSTNYGRLAAQTIFTLFFAGHDFAPNCVIDGQNIQDYLQSHFINAFGQLSDRIRDAGDLFDECVIGWDSMNEPHGGWCGYPDLNKTPSQQTSTLKKGTFPTPAQSLRLGMGQAQTVDNWKFGSFGESRDGSVTIDPKGYKIWSDPSTEPNGVHPKWGWKRDPGWKLGTCVWAQHGVWDIETGYVMIPDYFKYTPDEPGRDVMFIEDYWKPHWHAYSTRIRQAHPDAILFVAPPVFAIPPPIEEDHLKGRCCYSAHYYDGLTLITRHWSWFNADALGVLRGKYSSTLAAVKIGEWAIRKSFQEQLGILKEDAVILGPYPTVIGEIGIPYDMDSKRAYGYTDHGRYKGDYSSQQKALDASMNAADGPNGLSYTIWNYCPDNSHRWGDGWCMEDLSVWSPDDVKLHSEYNMELPDMSSAMLLKGGEVVECTPAAGASSLTLSTLTSPQQAKEDMQRSKSNITSLSGWDTTYDFLTDGARAPKAFCRPFPAAIVGLPQNIEFNIAKSEFKFTVRVRPEDAPTTDASMSEQVKRRTLATEIFVPLVHYASESALSRSRGRSMSSEPTLDGGSSRGLSPYVSERRLPSETSSISCVREWDHSALDLPGPIELDIMVNVTEGEWELDGQTLFWWYPPPPKGEPDREYTIVITRRGGAIKAAQESRSCDLSAMLETISPCPCPEGCSIM